MALEPGIAVLKRGRLRVEGVGLRMGPGFLVRGAEAHWSRASRLDLEHVEADEQANRLAGLRSPFGIGNGGCGFSGRRGARVDLVAESLAAGEPRSGPDTLGRG